MCREVFFWFIEYLNYSFLYYFSVKFLMEQCKISISENKKRENIILYFIGIPISIFSVGNCKYVSYSNGITYILAFYIYLVLKILSHGKAKKLFSISLLYVNILRLIDLLFVAIIIEVNHMSRYVYIDLVHMGVTRSIYLFSLIVIGYKIFKVCRKSSIVYFLYDNNIYRWGMCFYSFLGTSSFFRVYRFDYTEKMMEYWIFYLLCAFVYIGGTWFYIIEIKGREREKLLNMRNDMMEANYKGLKNVYDVNKTLQHDYKNHMLALYELVKENKTEDALNYIYTYIDLSKKPLKVINSGNDIVDIIINSKISEAENKNIHFSYEVEYMGDLKIQNIDMCALIANLLDNAIEACEKVDFNRAWIELEIMRRKEMLLIQVKNSIHPDKFKKQNFFESEKKNTQLHGWGIKSIERVINKYGGIKEHIINDECFEIFINIPL